MKTEQNNEKLIPPFDEEDYLEWLEELQEEESYNSCCAECGCYHGHHPWCQES